DKSKPYFPLAGLSNDGYSRPEEATATCYCGAVQLAFPVEGPGLGPRFVCNCTDCRKLHSSMLANNFCIQDEYLKHNRGEDNLSIFGTDKTILRGSRMDNYFCKTCGSLMYRVGAGSPGWKILRVGTVDDFSVQETKLKPTVEQFVKDRVGWFAGPQIDGIRRYEGRADEF
ncbi:Mss4-like protein, partial [Flagelloscypha sp. PMI_526]